MEREEEVLAAGEDAAECLRQIRFVSPAHVAARVAEARRLMAATPRAFRRTVHRATMQDLANAEVDVLLAAPALAVAPGDIPQGVQGEALVLLDARPAPAYVAAHVAGAHGAAGTGRVDALLRQKVVGGAAHVCVIGAGGTAAEDAAARALVEALVERGVARVAMVDGGHPACAEAAAAAPGTLEIEGDSQRGERGGAGGGVGARLEGLSLLGQAGGRRQEALKGAMQLLSSAREGAGQLADRTKGSLAQTAADPRVQAAADKTRSKALTWGRKGLGLLSASLTSASSLAREVRARRPPTLRDSRRADAPGPRAQVAQEVGASLEPSASPGAGAGGGTSGAGARFSIEDDEENEGGGAAGGGSYGGLAADGEEEFQVDAPINVVHWAERPFTTVSPAPRLPARPAAAGA